MSQDSDWPSEVPLMSRNPEEGPAEAGEGSSCEPLELNLRRLVLGRLAGCDGFSPGTPDIVAGDHPESCSNVCTFMKHGKAHWLLGMSMDPQNLKPGMLKLRLGAPCVFQNHAG